MSELIFITDASRSALDRSGLPERAQRMALRTSDYRKLLSDMRTRPPSQRAFLKKLLMRAALSAAVHEFPVINHAVPSLVNHT